MMDLTTLEGADTPGKVAALAAKAIQPDPADPSVPSCAAICVYPNLVPAALDRVRGTGVKVASVATAFPSGQSPLAVKLRDVEEAVALGADEIDMVIDRGAFLSGRYAKVYDEIVRVKEACGHAHLKVILETGELGTYDNVRRASLLAMAAGRRLHQDLDRQAAEGRDAARAAVHARGDPRRARRDRPRRRDEAGGRHPDRQAGDPEPRDRQRDARRRTGSRPTASGSARPRCSTTC